MKGVQCYELFGGIALKNHAFSISISTYGFSEAVDSIILMTFYLLFM